MRKIKMIGTALALPPYRLGETAFVPEGTAYSLARTGELQYADPRDTVSAEQANLLLVQMSRAQRQREADETGVEQYISPENQGKVYLPYANDPTPRRRQVAEVIQPKR